MLITMKLILINKTYSYINWSQYQEKYLLPFADINTEMLQQKAFLFGYILIITTLISQSEAIRIQHQYAFLGHEMLTLNGHLQSLTHSQVSEPVYDQQRYLVSLAQKQNKFKQQIHEIQNDFVGINIMLNDSTLSQNQKTIKLTETLADQREALIKAQKQLNLPYELKSCQCLNLSEQKKIDLQQKLQKVKAKIQQLQKSAADSNAHCQGHDCPLMAQVNQEIQMMKSYQEIMEKTISSKCCKIMKYEYKDNLDNNNWHFGSTTQSQYQAKIFEREQGSEIKLQACPYSVPFVKLQSNSCFTCPQQKPLFNLGSRLCQKDCTQSSKNAAYTLNLTTHVCGYNVDCPRGQYFDQTSKKCWSTPNYTNESSCPPERPFWDPQSYSCQSCPNDMPFFDVVLKKCRKCRENQLWNQSTRQCEGTHTCADGFYYDKALGKCVPTSENTHSLCPPERPYWSEVTFSCDQCPNQKPFYDAVQKLCRVCTNEQTFKEATKQCVPNAVTVSCLNDEYYNTETKTCQKRGTTSMCPPSTPFWDSKSFKCSQCPADKPLFNSATRKCQPCLLNYQWSALYQACIQNCAFDQQWNNQFKRCIRKDKTCPQMYTFSYEMNTCVQIDCDATKPYWNSTESVCQPCPSGTTYNYVSNTCQGSSRSGNVSVCNQDKPLWNPEFLRCQPCPQGRQWNIKLKACTLPVNRHQHRHNLFNTPKPHHSLSSQEDKQIQGQIYGNNLLSYQYKQLDTKSSL